MNSTKTLISHETKPNEAKTVNATIMVTSVSIAPITARAALLVLNFTGFSLGSSRFSRSRLVLRAASVEKDAPHLGQLPLGD
jgi:hypothetical protein